MRLVLPVVFAAFFFFALPARAQEQKHTNAPSLATSGLILFAGTYGYAATMGASLYRMNDDSVASKMFIPVAGPWLLLKDEHWDQESMVTSRLIEATHANRCDTYFCPAVLLFVPVAIVELGLLVIDPIAQATGIVMTFVGAAKESSANETVARASGPKVSVKPTSMGAMGAGVSLSITEW